MCASRKSMCDWHLSFWALRFLSRPDVVPSGVFAFQEGAEVVERVGARFVPVHAGTIQAARDDAIAGRLDATAAY